MNAGPTSERVLEAIRRDVLAGTFRPGARLDPAWFADELNTSVTPVRDALHVLVGQGLVEARTSDGFHIPHVSEADLRDLYVWNGQLLRLIIRAWKSEHETDARSASSNGPTDRASRLFSRIAHGSPNIEHWHQLSRTSDRLESSRRVEAQIVRGVGEELDRLEAMLDAGDRKALGKAVDAYHARRASAVSAIVRALYRRPR
ncbi:GntR family transcriptional regulator [Sphingomonas sp. BIUV-7]|uniref:GntR family transcriptional regulator n=1 Tax=Sphingomonas natans TaxID=3063330 RepID=A0ABT8YCU5_9SPHN|nr:GntR family transcriptional regulator [Sphingomonas sp. BIUV-7]MDO6416141.1 GntR family transcriptional regulator [Sphingomonas sp. BIUV-7]